MKDYTKVTIILFACCFNSIFAQLQVDTFHIHKKTAVLEMFTGMYQRLNPQCQRFAENRTQRFNDIVYLNLHHKAYHTRDNMYAKRHKIYIEDAEIISDSLGLMGFSIGSINRRTFHDPQFFTGKFVSDPLWSEKVDSVVAETSFANMAAKGEFDWSSNELTVDVELFIADTTAPDSIFLHVALLQDSIISFQLSGDYYENQFISNDKYVHKHVVRDLITGTWGEKIDSTKRGTLIRRSFTYTVPEYYQNVKVVVEQLKIAAYVSSGYDNIETGVYGDIQINYPLNSALADLSIIDKTVHLSTCDDHFIPSYIISNKGPVTVDSFYINLTLNDTIYQSHLIKQQIAPGNEALVNLDSVSIPFASSNTCLSEVSLNGIPGVYETNHSNNEVRTVNIVHLNSNTARQKNIESFEILDATTNLPKHTVLVNPENGDYKVFEGSGQGAYGKSDNLFVWDKVFDYYETESSLILDGFSLNGSKTAIISFAYSYGWYLFNDVFEVYASGDCGKSWSRVWKKYGEHLSTVKGVITYPPKIEWQTEIIDISHLSNTHQNLILKFKLHHNLGHDLFLDDIQVATRPTGIENTAERKLHFEIFPNPVEHTLQIDVKNVQSSHFDMKIFDSQGKIIREKNSMVIEGNSEMINYDVSTLQTGFYFIQLVSNHQSVVHPFIRK